MLRLFSFSRKQEKILGQEWIGSKIPASLLCKNYLLIETDWKEKKVRQEKGLDRKKEKRYFQRGFISRDSYYERKMELFSSFLIMVNIFKGIL